MAPGFRQVYGVAACPATQIYGTAGFEMALFNIPDQILIRFIGNKRWIPLTDGVEGFPIDLVGQGAIDLFRVPYGVNGFSRDD